MKLIKSLAGQFGFSVVLALVQLLQLNIMYKNLTEVELGLYAILMIQIVIVQALCDSGVSSFCLSRGNLGKSFNSVVHVFTVAMSLVISIVSLIIGLILSVFYSNYELFEFSVLLFSGFTVLTLVSFYQYILIVKMRLVLISFYDVLSRTISLIFLSVFFYLNMGLYSFVFSWLIFCFTKFFLYYMSAKKEVDFKFFTSLRKRDVVIFKSIFRFSTYQLLAQGLNSFATKVDEVLIGKILGIEKLGIYSLFKNLIVQIGFLVLPIVRRTTIPLLQKNKTMNFFKLTNIMTTTGIFFYFSGIAIVSSQIIENIYSSELLIYTYSFICLAIAWALRLSAGTLLASLFVVIKKPEYELYWNLLQFLSLSAFFFIFWPESIFEATLMLIYGYLFSFLFLNSLFLFFIYRKLFDVIFLNGFLFFYILIMSGIVYLLSGLFNEGDWISILSSILSYLGLGGCIALILYKLIYIKLKGSEYAL